MLPASAPFSQSLYLALSCIARARARAYCARARIHLHSHCPALSRVEMHVSINILHCRPLITRVCDIRSHAFACLHLHLPFALLLSRYARCAVVMSARIYPACRCCNVVAFVTVARRSVAARYALLLYARICCDISPHVCHCQQFQHSIYSSILHCIRHIPAATLCVRCCAPHLPLIRFRRFLQILRHI